MSDGLAIMLVVFTALLLLRTPVAIVIGASTVLAAWALGYQSVLPTTSREMANGLDNYPLLAIPFFVLAGDLMGAGGLPRRVGGGQHRHLHVVRGDFRLGAGCGFLGGRHAHPGDEPQGLRQEFQHRRHCHRGHHRPVDSTQ